MISIEHGVNVIHDISHPIRANERRNLQFIPILKKPEALLEFAGDLDLSSGWDWIPIVIHQQRLYFPSGTLRCSGQLWRLWRNLVPSERELHVSRHPGDGSRCMHTSPRVYWTDVVAFRCTWEHLGARWITVEQSGNNTFFGNAAGAPGNQSYYLSFNDIQNLCIQFVFSSMYLCIYIATYLNTVYQDWQHAVNGSNSRCTWIWRSSQLRDILRGCDGASLETQSETMNEWTQRCTGRLWSSEFGDAFWGRDRASSEMQLETEIEWTRWCTGRPWSSDFGYAPGCRDQVNTEMNAELWSSKFRDAPAAGYDWGWLEKYLEVVDL